MMKEFENLLILWWMEVFKSYFQKYLNEYYSLTFKKGHISRISMIFLEYSKYRKVPGRQREDVYLSSGCVSFCKSACSASMTINRMRDKFLHKEDRNTKES